MDNKIFWIWFSLVFGCGTRRSELFMNYFSSPEDIYNKLKTDERIKSMLVAKELNNWEKSLDIANEIYVRTLKKDCNILTPNDKNYPESLRQIYSNPAVLYAYGDISVLNNICVAIVGSRKTSAYGERAATKISYDLAKNNITIVSGLAHGIDTFAHTAALEAMGKTVAVMGCGMDVNYPKGSAKLKRRISENGVLITELPLGAEPLPHVFPTRNRIISGLSRAVAVIEAGMQSGSLITANLALEQGKDVFAVPGNIFSKESAGANYLIKEGAIPLCCAEDILSEYNIAVNKIRANPPPIQIKLNIKETAANENLPENKKAADVSKDVLADLSDEAKNILDILNKPMNVEEIVQKTNLKIADLHVALTELEIFSLIECTPGRIYSKI